MKACGVTTNIIFFALFLMPLDVRLIYLTFRGVIFCRNICFGICLHLFKMCI